MTISQISSININDIIISSPAAPSTGISRITILAFTTPLAPPLTATSYYLIDEDGQMMPFSCINLHQPVPASCSICRSSCSSWNFIRCMWKSNDVEAFETGFETIWNIWEGRFMTPNHNCTISTHCKLQTSILHWLNVHHEITAHAGPVYS